MNQPRIQNTVQLDSLNMMSNLPLNTDQQDTEGILGFLYQVGMFQLDN